VSVTKSVCNLVIDRIVTPAVMEGEAVKVEAIHQLVKVDVNPSFKAVGNGVTLASWRYFATRSWEGGEVFNRGKEVVNHFLNTPTKEGKSISGNTLKHASVVESWFECDYASKEDGKDEVTFKIEKLPLPQLLNWIELASQMEAFEVEAKKQKEAKLKELTLLALPDSRFPLPKKEAKKDTTTDNTPSEVIVPDFD